MKLNVRLLWHFGLTSFLSLAVLLLIYLNSGFKDQALNLTGKGGVIGHLWIILLVAVGMGIAISLIAYFHSNITLKKIKELMELLKKISDGEPIEVHEGRYHDGLGEIRRELIEIHTNQKQSWLEFEDKYRKLLLSNMNLEEKYAQSYTIQLVLEEIGRELDSDQLLKKTSDIIMGVFGSKRCTIYMVNEEEECLVVRAESGSVAANGETTIIPLTSDHIIARSWKEKRGFSELEARDKDLKEFKLRNTQSFNIFPLTGRRGCLGVMFIEHELTGGLTPDLVDFAKLIAQEISLSVENAYLYEKMRQMANHDALTGVYNRMYLMTYMYEVFSKDPKTVSLIMLDLDHFKKVNDKYGHLAGDMVLKMTTALIQKMLPTGIVGRYGGEEFVVLLPEVGQEDAYQFANSVRRKISEHHFITGEGVKIPVTISAGLANYPQVSDSFKGLLQLADEALYEAKGAGRNKVCIAFAKEAGILSHGA